MTRASLDTVTRPEGPIGPTRRIGRVAIDYARRKLPGVPFFSADVLELDEPELKHLLACDYLVINGLFTRKGELGTSRCGAS